MCEKKSERDHLEDTGVGVRMKLWDVNGVDWILLAQNRPHRCTSTR
jgi:hypothetical protein